MRKKTLPVKAWFNSTSAQCYRQVGEHPDGQNANADNGPGVGKCLEVVERGGRNDPTNLVHAMAQRHIARNVADHNYHYQDLGFAIAVGVHPSCGLVNWICRLDTLTGLNH